MTIMIRLTFLFSLIISSALCVSYFYEHSFGFWLFSFVALVSLALVLFPGEEGDHDPLRARRRRLHLFRKYGRRLG